MIWKGGWIQASNTIIRNTWPYSTRNPPHRLRSTGQATTASVRSINPLCEWWHNRSIHLLISWMVGNRVGMYKQWMINAFVYDANSQNMCFKKFRRLLMVSFSCEKQLRVSVGPPWTRVPIVGSFHVLRLHKFDVKRLQGLSESEAIVAACDTIRRVHQLRLNPHKKATRTNSLASVNERKTRENSLNQVNEWCL